jgi:hypothetical protein
MNKNAASASLVAAVWLLLFVALSTTHASAQTVPALINYQGKLVTSNGLPVSTGDYQLRFRIYDAATNGNLIWGPQIFNGQTGPGYGPLVPVVQGWFNVVLGPVDTNSAPIANAFNAPNRYLEIRVATNAPVMPRQQILSAPYALHAGSAETAHTATIAQSAVTANTVPDGSITGAKIASGAVGSNQLANGSVGTAQLAPGAFAFVPRRIQVFTSSGTWIKPAEVSTVYVKVIGRGGNGGDANNSRPRGGGGGGGYAEGFVAVTGDVTVTIGAVNSFAGVTTIQATAGSNGSGYEGGAGGVGSGGSINLRGGSGQNVSETVNGTGGMGGGTPMGTGGTGGALVGGVTYFPAGNGGNYGGGGGGATNEPRNGGTGDPGAVIVYH